MKSAEEWAYRTADFISRHVYEAINLERRSLGEDPTKEPAEFSECDNCCSLYLCRDCAVETIKAAKAESYLAGAQAMQKTGVSRCLDQCRTDATEEAYRSGLAIAGQRLSLIDPKQLEEGG